MGELSSRRVTRESTGERSGMARLLEFARSLREIHSFDRLLEVCLQEVRAMTGYSHAWLLVKEADCDTQLRVLEVSGDHRANLWEVAPVLKIPGDPFLEALLVSSKPLVIEDARTDPRTNKAIVEQLQNRTLINIPLTLLDAPFGVFGVGTFGDEGCRAPSAQELDYLSGMTSPISVAASRIRWMESQAKAADEKAELVRRAAQAQQVDGLQLLAGRIAHDFNNLLTIITIGGSLIDELTTESNTRQEARQILQATRRAASLARKLTAMSRTREL